MTADCLNMQTAHDLIQSPPCWASRGHRWKGEINKIEIFLVVLANVWLQDSLFFSSKICCSRSSRREVPKYKVPPTIFGSLALRRRIFLALRYLFLKAPSGNIMPGCCMYLRWNARFNFQHRRPSSSHNSFNNAVLHPFSPTRYPSCCCIHKCWQC